LCAFEQTQASLRGSSPLSMFIGAFFADGETRDRLDPRGRSKGWTAKGPLHLTLWHPGDGSGKAGRRLILPSVGEKFLCEATGVAIRARSACLIVRCPELEQATGRWLHATLSVRGVQAKDSTSPKSGALLEWWPLEVKFEAIVAEGGRTTSQRAAASSHILPGGWANWVGWTAVDVRVDEEVSGTAREDDSTPAVETARPVREDSLTQAGNDEETRGAVDLSDETVWPPPRSWFQPDSPIEAFIEQATAYVRSVIAKTGFFDLVALQEHLRGDQSWNRLCLPPLRKFGSPYVVTKGGRKANAYSLHGLRAVDRHGRHGARVFLSRLFLENAKNSEPRTIPRHPVWCDFTDGPYVKSARPGRLTKLPVEAKPRTRGEP